MKRVSVGPRHSKRFSFERIRGRMKTMIARDYPNVRWVADALDDFMATLAPEDITRANANSLTNCSNARCMKRVYKGCMAVVSKSVAFVIIGDTAVRYLIHRETNASRVIMDNDKNGSVIVGTRIKLYAPKGYNLLGEHTNRQRNATTAKREPGEPVTVALLGERLPVLSHRL